MSATRDGRLHIAICFNLQRLHPGDEGFAAEAEFDSPTTVAAVAEAVQAAQPGAEVLLIEADRSLPDALVRLRPDLVVNLAEGVGGRTRESQVPALCDLLGIEHTGSDATAVGVCHDKALARTVVAAAGVRVARGMVCRSRGDALAARVPLPAIVKPVAEGSSKGVSSSSVVRTREELVARVAALAPSFPAGLLVEEYVGGRELTIGLLDDGSAQGPRVIGSSELIFDAAHDDLPVHSQEMKSGVVPWELRGRRGVVVRGATYRIEAPAPLEADHVEAVHAMARSAFRALGLRDVARIDLKLDESGPCFLEANPLPGLAPGCSDLVLAADADGMRHAELVAAILRPALARAAARREAALLERWRERLELREGPHGTGVHARVAFARGEVMARSVGHLEPRQHSHTIQTGWNTHVLVGAPIVLVNHGCRPNARFEVAEDSTEVTLRAITRIAPGDELRVDYATFEHRTSAFAALSCGCGAPECRRRVVGWSGLSDEDRSRLLPLAADYLRSPPRSSIVTYSAPTRAEPHPAAPLTAVPAVPAGC